jgi:hypothetical protein
LSFWKNPVKATKKRVQKKVKDVKKAVTDPLGTIKGAWKDASDDATQAGDDYYQHLKDNYEFVGNDLGDKFGIHKFWNDISGYTAKKEMEKNQERQALELEQSKERAQRSLAGGSGGPQSYASQPTAPRSIGSLYSAPTRDNYLHPMSLGDQYRQTLLGGDLNEAYNKARRRT